MKETKVETEMGGWCTVQSTPGDLHQFLPTMCYAHAALQKLIHSLPLEAGVDLMIYLSNKIEWKHRRTS